MVCAPPPSPTRRPRRPAALVDASIPHTALVDASLTLSGGLISPTPHPSFERTATHSHTLWRNTTAATVTTRAAPASVSTRPCRQAPAPPPEPTSPLEPRFYRPSRRRYLGSHQGAGGTGCRQRAANRSRWRAEPLGAAPGGRRWRSPALGRN